VKVAYEAGPTGYELARACAIVAVAVARELAGHCWALATME
jgi:hypothetical protein